jgi:hypothetical protein
MLKFQSVPVPDSIVPIVMSLVADWLVEQGEVGDVSHQRAGASSWSEFAETDDPDDVYEWLQNWLRPKERNILRALADAPSGQLTAPDLAEILGITSASLAGVVGPLSRRLRRDGYPRAIESRLATSSDGTGRRIKYLSIPTELSDLLTAHWPSSMPVSTERAVTRRPKGNPGAFKGGRHGDTRLHTTSATAKRPKK